MHDFVTHVVSALSTFEKNVAVVATSCLAYRIYAALIASAVLATSIWVAYRQRAWLMNLRPGQFERSFQGPKPKRKKTIEKQLGQLVTFKRNKLLSACVSVALLLVCGFAIPCVLAAALVMNLSWFSSTAHFLVVNGTRPVLHPDVHQTAFFVLSQLCLGVAGTPTAIASNLGVSIANVDFDASSIVNILAVFGFRDFEGLFTGVFGHFSWTLVQVLRATPEKEIELRDALAALARE